MSTKTMNPRTPAKQERLPTIGRGSTNPKRSSVNGNSKAKGKPNGSILSFFKKADDEPTDELFVQSKNGFGLRKESSADRNTHEGIGAAEDGMEEDRYNENGGSVKRRKLSGTDEDIQAASEETPVGAQRAPVTIPGGCTPPPPDAAKPAKLAGPFVEESDSENDEDVPQVPVKASRKKTPPAVPEDPDMQAEEPEQEPEVKKETKPDTPDDNTDMRPTLSRAGTSYGDIADFADYEASGDFEDDIYDEGEEFVERRWMEEQARLEAEDGGDVIDEEGQAIKLEEMPTTDADAPTCPICSIGLGGVSDQDAAVHVNNCLDGNPTPLPEAKRPSSSGRNTPNSGRNTPSEGQQAASRFKRPPRPPKPGQENPFSLGGPSTNGSGSAFSKLMSGHAEDAAWATAAAAEHAARGKPAYQRTCPFYKILPGFSICVDAFRYGAVEGCKAYFLSHFHSDHYIGLTSSWCHGPIYCSRVTANLVRQQLRVDPKWVVDLEFEQKVEVPGTHGVFVTMIPANHCPGSSLYLYEKVVGKGANPKVQRVLHCGDFRACKAHVEHPLLRPDVLDAVSGKERQQKLDVCYLDTTYLNPKYAFPNQEEVIKACADMCVSLNKVEPDESDGWEQMKRERAGTGMVKFVRKDSNPVIKEEENDDVAGTKTPAVGKQRGKLLVVVGTYSIGKERICLGIARALNSKIYAPPGKQRICACLEDPELNARLTKDPREAQVHMTPLFEIRADTLDDYLKDYKDYFSRCVGFRPSGWNYRPPNSRFVESPAVQTVLHSENWKSTYSMKELVPQRGSTSRASCFGVPYSEHSSFRELTMFCCALRIDKVIPTVNVGSAKSREKMKGWCEKWAMEKKKNGLFRIADGKW